MTKKYATKQFNQFLPMIEKACWHYSKKYKIDHSEISGQGYLIFCEALKTFDKSKACFSTHLTNELERLDIYCHKQIGLCHISNKGSYHKRYKGILSNEEISKDINACYDMFDKVISRMDYEISLSQDAKEIVTYILSRDWEILDDNWKPRFSYIQKKYCKLGWTQNRIKMAWKEIREWWVSENKDQFCLEV